jgi:hypothetical protein
MGGLYATRVVRFYRIDERGDVQQIGEPPAPFPMSVKRMGDTYERILRAQALDRLVRRESRRDLLGHKSGQEFAAGGHDLLADDDPPGIDLLRLRGAAYRIVIGDHHAVDILADRTTHKVAGGKQAVL